MQYHNNFSTKLKLISSSNCVSSFLRENTKNLEKVNKFTRCGGDKWGAIKHNNINIECLQSVPRRYFIVEGKLNFHIMSHQL